jgi:hypothetical protein
MLGPHATTENRWEPGERSNSLPSTECAPDVLGHSRGANFHFRRGQIIDVLIRLAHTDLLLTAHQLRVERGDFAISEMHLADIPESDDPSNSTLAVGRPRPEDLYCRQQLTRPLPWRS